MSKRASTKTSPRHDANHRQRTFARCPAQVLGAHVTQKGSLVAPDRCASIFALPADAQSELQEWNGCHAQVRANSSARRA